MNNMMTLWPKMTDIITSVVAKTLFSISPCASCLVFYVLNMMILEEFSKAAFHSGAFQVLLVLENKNIILQA